MQTINDTLSHVKVGTEVTFRNLTMFPLLDGSSGQPDYLTLDEALAQKQARITEIEDGGSVPELKFVNEGEQKVLLVDGEELVGAKQNRVLNLTILVPAKQTLVIPVSCVEAGRWAHESADFAAAGHTHYATGRLRKMAQVTESLESTGERRSDQGAIWGHISEKAERLSAHSPTHAMAAMYERHGQSIDDYVGALSAVEGQAGALFAINGQVIGFDLFDYGATLQKLLPKLVRSYALDALDAQMDTPTVDNPTAPSAMPSRPTAEEFLARVTTAQAQSFSSIGVGEDVRLSGAKLTGGALIAEERVIHLSVFHLADGMAEGAEGQGLHAEATRISRPSLRRRYQGS